MSTDKAHITWMVIGAALCVWAGVGLFAWTVTNAAAERAERMASLKQEEAERASAFRVHTLARETQEERNALNMLAQQDIISIIESIERVGTTARVSLEIGQALAERENTSESGIRSVNVVVDATGSFSAVMHALALLETLPLPSEITQTQLERLPGESGKGGWRAVVHITVFTTVDISS